MSQSPVCGGLGYALVDALIALLILAIALIFGLQATQQARLAADQASEVRRANSLLAHLLAVGPRGEPDVEGLSNGFVWKIETRTTGAEQPIAVCRRGIMLTNERSKRVFQAATLEACPQRVAG